MPDINVYQLIKKYEIHPKKRLGQHFLAEDPTIRKIVATSGISKDDVVLEIGPGLGVMTQYLASIASRVIAIDTDHNLIDVAKGELSHHKNIEWINLDILKYKLTEKVVVIGNLPYNISSQIIFWMLGHRNFIKHATIMIQKEVALRLCAKPSTKDYGILSVILQSSAEIKKLFDVSKSCFVPPPKVTSSIVGITFKENPSYNVDEDWFSKVVKASFGKRRKTIRNSILGSNLEITPDDLDLKFAKANIDPKRRAEALTVLEFAKLAKELRIKTNNLTR